MEQNILRLHTSETLIKYIVILLQYSPCLGENPITKMYMGTKIPPPPIPPPAASISPQIANENPILSLVERGNNDV